MVKESLPENAYTAKGKTIIHKGLPSLIYLVVLPTTDLLITLDLGPSIEPEQKNKNEKEKARYESTVYFSPCPRTDPSYVSTTYLEQNERPYLLPTRPQYDSNTSQTFP